MLTYQFDLLNRSGRRSCLCVTECFSDNEAVNRALAMLVQPYARVKVWRGDIMIHDEIRSFLPN
jgi:hypothetical protein